MNNCTFPNTLLQVIEANKIQTVRVIDLRPGDVIGTPETARIILAAPGSIHAPSYIKHTFRMFWRISVEQLRRNSTAHLPTLASEICYWRQKPYFSQEQPGADGYWHNTVYRLGSIPDYRLDSNLNGMIRMAARRDRKISAENAYLQDEMEFNKRWGWA